MQNNGKTTQIILYNYIIYSMRTSQKSYESQRNPQTH